MQDVTTPCVTAPIDDSIGYDQLMLRWVYIATHCYAFEADSKGSPSSLNLNRAVKHDNRS